GQSLALRIRKTTEEAILETRIRRVVFPENRFRPGFIKVGKQPFRFRRVNNAVEDAFLFRVTRNIRSLPLLRRVLKFPPVGTFQRSRVVAPRAAPVGKAVEPPLERVVTWVRLGMDGGVFIFGWIA